MNFRLATRPGVCPCILLATLPLLACSDDGSPSGIYGDSQGDEAVTIDDGEDDDEEADSSSSGESESESDTGAPKLDTLPEDTGVDDGLPEDCVEDVDIVFVMDVSTTMGPFFDKLELEIGVVHDALMEYDLPGEPHYGLVVFVDDFTLVGAGVPYTDVAALTADFAYWNNFTSTNQQTKGGGFNSTWTENSLDALYAAAGGFQWRPKDKTLRLIIHTTDDTFWNGPVMANGVDILHNYPEVVDALQAKEIRMFAFAALIGGQSGGDDVSMGFFTPFQGQPPIPELTGGAAYNIDEVLAGVQSLSAAINAAVDDTYCEPYPPTQ